MVENFRNFTQYSGDDDPIQIRTVGEGVCDETYRISRRNSDVMAIEYIVSGSGTMEIDGQTLKPSEGDVFFISKGSNHRYYSDKDNPWHKYWIIFDGPFAIAMMKNYLPEGVHLFSGCHVGKLFEKIFRIAFDAGDNYVHMVDEITVELMKIFISIKNRIAGESATVPDMIRARIDCYVEKGFSLDALCRDFNYSKNHIIYLFEERFGKTPYQYYLERRIETAKSYLQNSTMSVGEIAAMLSYTDQQYFSSCFKRAVGCSPSQFRKLVRS